VNLPIALDLDILKEFCQAHHIRKLALFGSVLREDFHPESDVDMLVEFEPGTEIGLIGFSALEIELSNILGHKVDLNTPQDLSLLFREKVLSLAQVLYERK
jgi:uncharacterized protein